MPSHLPTACDLLQAPIPINQLRDFIAYARSNCYPELCAEAATDIVDGYMHMRRMGSSRKVRPRALLSVIGQF